jgi:hypothetical protein
MRQGWPLQAIMWGTGLLVLVIAIWGLHQGQSQASSPSPTQVKTIVLRPDSVPVVAGGLTGEMEQLRVTERVERKTGKILGEPDLRGVLQLSNTSTNLVIRPIAGSVEYVDGGGTGIPLAKDQGTTAFTIYTERSGGLRPGEQTSQVIDVPFPADALKAHRLQDVRLHLTYLSTPYAKITINGPVVLGP